MIRTRYTSPNGQRHFDLVRTDIETYIRVEGQDIVDDVPEWVAYYVRLGYRPGPAN